jgi:hypothetical protein
MITLRPVATMTFKDYHQLRFVCALQHIRTLNLTAPIAAPNTAARTIRKMPKGEERHDSWPVGRAPFRGSPLR